MRQYSLKEKKEIILYFVIFCIGIVLIYISFHKSDFYQNLLLSLGSNMVVITIVFTISKLFKEISNVPPELQGKLADMASPNKRQPERSFNEASNDKT